MPAISRRISSNGTTVPVGLLGLARRTIFVFSVRQARDLVHVGPQVGLGGRDRGCARELDRRAEITVPMLGNNHFVARPGISTHQRGQKHHRTGSADDAIAHQAVLLRDGFDPAPGIRCQGSGLNLQWSRWQPRWLSGSGRCQFVLRQDDRMTDVAFGLLGRGIGRDGCQVRQGENAVAGQGNLPQS
jgi:hypothetical protein